MFSLERNQICQTLTSGSQTSEWLDLVALKKNFFHQYNIYNTYVSKKTSTIQLLYLRFRDHSWRRARNTVRARGAGTLLWDVSPKNVRETYKEKQSSPVKSTQLIIQYHVSSPKNIHEQQYTDWADCIIYTYACTTIKGKEAMNLRQTSAALSHSVGPTL